MPTTATDFNCSNQWGNTKNCLRKTTRASFICISLPATIWILNGTEHVRWHEMRSVLATHEKRSTQNGDRLLQMYMQRSKEDAKVTPEVFPSQWPTRVYGHGHTWPLAKNSTGNQFVAVMTDCYSKLKRPLPASENRAPHVSCIFCYHWNIPYRI